MLRLLPIYYIAIINFIIGLYVYIESHLLHSGSCSIVLNITKIIHVIKLMEIFLHKVKIGIKSFPHKYTLNIGYNETIYVLYLTYVDILELLY